MKKLMILALALVLLLTACGEAAPSGPQEIVRNTESGEQTTGSETTTASAQAVYSYTFEGVELVPGAAFDPAALPEAESVYTVPSCALEGTDNVYSYGTIEVTAFNSGDGEYIYSVYLTDPNAATAEGLSQGDDEAKVKSLYGEDHTVNGGELIYKLGDTMLCILLQDGVVVGIDYRLAV